jgi:hypothetical protein
MAGTFFDANAPRFDPTGLRRLQELPHGLVRPPAEVVAQVARDRARFTSEVYDDAYAKRTLDDWTLAYYYEGLDVAYRSVPEGVEVLAVGLDEISAYLRTTPPEQRPGVKVKQA